MSPDEVMQIWRDAFARQDASALTRLFAADGRLFSPGPTLDSPMNVVSSHVVGGDEIRAVIDFLLRRHPLTGDPAVDVLGNEESVVLKIDVSTHLGDSSVTHVIWTDWRNDCIETAFWFVEIADSRIAPREGVSQSALVDMRGWVEELAGADVAEWPLFGVW